MLLIYFNNVNVSMKKKKKNETKRNEISAE